MLRSYMFATNCYIIYYRSLFKLLIFYFITSNDPGVSGVLFFREEPEIGIEEQLQSHIIIETL